MENMDGFATPKKPEIIPYLALPWAFFTVADNIYLTIMQKREKPP